jgi:hypothetical protein
MQWRALLEMAHKQLPRFFGQLNSYLHSKSLT